jgi:alkylhydroperoxidase family enzyme
MAWIRIVQPEEAEGLLAQLYREAVGRAGKVFQILRVQSLRPRALRASVSLYTELMHSPGRLSRARREMIATTVSRANGCHY